MIPRADMLVAQGVIGPDDVAAMERQAREYLADQIGQMDVSTLVLKAQVGDPGRGRLNMVDVAFIVRQQIEDMVRG